MNRRALLATLGGAAVWLLAVHAQQDDRPRRVGILVGGTESDPVAQTRVAEFRRGLQELGWGEGRNIRFHYRWPGVDPPRIRAHAAEMVELAPDLIMATPAQVTLELKRLTRDLPILFVNVPDPVDLGLVASIAAPGGNMTGFANFEHALAGKWLGILKEMTPSAERIGVFYSRENPAWRARLRVIEEAAPSLGVRLSAVGVSEVGEIERAFQSFVHEKIAALIVLPSIFVSNQRASIVALAARHSFPAMYPFRYFVADGGLLAYGIDTNDQFRRAASYADRILKGAKPAELPVQAPTKFELVINLKTARELGLDVPPTLLARADEVIE